MANDNPTLAGICRSLEKIDLLFGLFLSNGFKKKMNTATNKVGQSSFRDKGGDEHAAALNELSDTPSCAVRLKHIPPLFFV
jgi:hypothetical protein